MRSRSGEIYIDSLEKGHLLEVQRGALGSGGGSLYGEEEVRGVVNLTYNGELFFHAGGSGKSPILGDFWVGVVT